jgi:hypothetical protein
MVNPLGHVQSESEWWTRSHKPGCFVWRMTKKGWVSQVIIGHRRDRARTTPIQSNFLSAERSLNRTRLIDVTNAKRNTTVTAGRDMLTFINAFTHQMPANIIDEIDEVVDEEVVDDSEDERSGVLTMPMSRSTADSNGAKGQNYRTHCD